MIYLKKTFRFNITFLNLSTMNKTYKILLFFLLLSQLSKSQNFFNQVVGGSGLDEINDIAKDSAGNIYSTGYFSSPLAQFGTFFLTNTSLSNSSDAYITKSSPTGNVLWTKKIGGPSQDKGKAIALDKFGNVFVTGTLSRVFLLDQIYH